MEALTRTIAIFIEILILAGIVYVLLIAFRLTVIDLGVGPKYGRAVVGVLGLVGVILLVFFLAHLITFYPEIGAGG